MAIDSKLEKRLGDYVDHRADRLVEIIRDLVRIPSENTPPTGSERACQDYVAGFLREQKWVPHVYELSEVPSLREHPLFCPGRIIGTALTWARGAQGRVADVPCCFPGILTLCLVARSNGRGLRSAVKSRATVFMAVAATT